MNPIRTRRPAPARRAALASLALLWTAAAAFAAPAAELPSERDRWIQLESEHFSIYSSAPEKVPRKLATRLERLRQVLAKLGGEGGLTLSRPTDIFVFKDERSWKPFRPLGANGKPRELGAYFLPRADRNSIALYDWDGGDPIEPILHEYLHSLTDVSFARIPVWANEGIADFYSTFTVGDDAADIGRPVRYAVQVLDQRARMPTRRLLAVTQDDPEYNESDRQTIFYAQAWLTTHFLLLGRPERRGDFGRYLAAIEAGAEPASAFVDAFGLEPEEVDKALDVAQRKRVYPFIAYRFAELPPLADFRLREVGYPETLARLGDLTRRLGPAERPRGIELLEAARRLDPASPLAPYGLALARRDDGKMDEALSLLREALARDPEFEPAQAALGTLLAIGAPGRLPEAAQAGEARGLLRKSTAQEPGRVETWIALGTVEAMSGGDRKAAIKAFENAWKLAPDRSDILATYTMALAEDGQFARAAAHPARHAPQELQPRRPDHRRGLPEADRRARSLGPGERGQARGCAGPDRGVPGGEPRRRAHQEPERDEGADREPARRPALLRRVQRRHPRRQRAEVRRGAAALREGRRRLRRDRRRPRDQGERSPRRAREVREEEEKLVGGRRDRPIAVAGEHRQPRVFVEARVGVGEAAAQEAAALRGDDSAWTQLSQRPARAAGALRAPRCSRRHVIVGQLVAARGRPIETGPRRALRRAAVGPRMTSSSPGSSTVCGAGITRSAPPGRGRLISMTRTPKRLRQARLGEGPAARASRGTGTRRSAKSGGSST